MAKLENQNYISIHIESTLSISCKIDSGNTSLVILYKQNKLREILDSFLVVYNSLVVFPKLFDVGKFFCC